MIASKGLRWSGQLISHGRRRQALNTVNRNAYSTSHHATRQLMVSSSRPLAPKLSRSMRHTVLPTLQLRPASTSSNSGVVAVAEPTSTPVESSVPAPVNQASDLATELNLFDIPEVPEQIGFLKELGLDYGWGPTATVEWILEHIYIYSGLPWWATIIATTAFLRMAMFSLSKNAIETGTRMRFMNPYIQPIKAKLEAARASKDRTAMLEAQQEMSQLYTRSSIKPQSLFYPMIQIPFAYGSFRLVRGMSTLPVPGMEAGGILWFSDLSLADPYFLLPAMTSGVMYLTFKLNELAGASSGTNPTMVLMMKWVLPSIGFLISCRFPAGLSFLFFCGSVMQLLQTSLFVSDRFRRAFGMTPRPPRAPTSPSTPSSSSGPTNTTTTGGTTTADGKQVGFVAGAIRDFQGVKEQAQKMMIRQGEGTPGAKGKAKINQEQAYESKRSRQETAEAARERRRFQEKRKKQKKKVA